MPRAGFEPTKLNSLYRVSTGSFAEPVESRPHFHSISWRYNWILSPSTVRSTNWSLLFRFTSSLTSKGDWTEMVYESTSSSLLP